MHTDTEDAEAVHKVDGLSSADRLPVDMIEEDTKGEMDKLTVDMEGCIINRERTKEWIHPNATTPLCCNLALTSRREARACNPVAAGEMLAENAETLRCSLALTSCREARA